MTCVIGLEHEGKVYIGADSLGVNGDVGVTLSTRKVFAVGGKFLIGVAGSVRMLNLLHYNLNVRPQNGETDEEYMVSVFIPAVRQALKDGGFTYIDSNREWVGNFLVAYKDGLYSVEQDLQINRASHGLYCVGSGAYFAWGAMLALQELEPKRRISKALEISGQLCPSVGGPYYVEVAE